MAGGLAKTRGGFLSRLFGRSSDQPVTAEWLAALEEALLRSDISVSLVDSVMLQVRDVVADRKADTIPAVLTAVREALVAVLATGDRELVRTELRPRVILVVGVNGSGKTTTAAKLAKRLKDAGETPLLAAADTFRAAAIEQLEATAHWVIGKLPRSIRGSAKDEVRLVFEVTKWARIAYYLVVAVKDI